MFIEFKERLINLDEIKYAVRVESFNSFGIDIHLKESKIIEIIFERESDRDDSFFILQNILIK